MDPLTLRTTTPEDPGTSALIATHFALMRSSSPEASCHVLPADDLKGQFMIAAERAGQVVGIGAFVEIAPGHAEIKSMHTAAEARGLGVARQILLELIAKAQAQGLTRASLETGSSDLFAPARALYHAEGFRDCPPFGTYVADPFSVFMTRTI